MKGLELDPYEPPEQGVTILSVSERALRHALTGPHRISGVAAGQGPAWHPRFTTTPSPKSSESLPYSPWTILILILKLSKD